MDQADSAPVATKLSLSAPTCSRTGDPPFTVTIKHHSTAPRPIWALVYNFTFFCAGIDIRDLQLHKHRGPTYTLGCLEEDPDERDDTSLQRLAPGQSLEMAYTLCVREGDDVFPSDMRRLKDGERYEARLRKRKWWWMFEDEMPPDCTTDDERRRVLREQKRCEWRPQCVVEFDVVA